MVNTACVRHVRATSCVRVCVCICMRSCVHCGDMHTGHPDSQHTHLLANIDAWLVQSSPCRACAGLMPARRNYAATTPNYPLATPFSDAVTAAFSRTLLPCTTPQASLTTLEPEQAAWQPKAPALHSCIIASSRRHARTHNHVSPGPNDCPEMFEFFQI